MISVRLECRLFLASARAQGPGRRSLHRTSPSPERISREITRESLAFSYQADRKPSSAEKSTGAVRPAGGATRLGRVKRGRPRGCVADGGRSPSGGGSGLRAARPPRGRQQRPTRRPLPQRLENSPQQIAPHRRQSAWCPIPGTGRRSPGRASCRSPRDRRAALFQCRGLPGCGRSRTGSRLCAELRSRPGHRRR